MELTLQPDGEKKRRKKLVAWGITGCGDRLNETIGVMKQIGRVYDETVEIRVYLSKAGEQVLKHYRLSDDLKQHFGKVRVEQSSNSPFLAGALQLGRFEFLMIAPATSNTVAKIALGIGDSLLSNSAIMALKAFVPVYIVPSDYKVGSVVTKLPSGRLLRLRTRKEDVAHAKRLVAMDNVHVLERPEELHRPFREHFGSNC
jgi:archaeoflavoprotein AfpA